MPNTLTLTRKTAPEAGPVAFTAIDEELCAARGCASDPTWYLDGWYDSIGGRLAAGRSWDEIRKSFTLQQLEAGERHDGAPYAELMGRLIEITDWLEERFEADCGYTSRAG